MKNFISYVRVSTARQGESGLGLEAQTSSVRDYVQREGTLVAEYVECESGKRSDRPQLAKALAHARRIGGTLVIAKLDRLARNVCFLANLVESGIPFVCVENPTMNRLTIHILAAVAEDEALRTSERTKAALKAYKARGGKLGAQNPLCKPLSKEAAKKGQRLGSASTARKATEAYRDLVPIVQELRDSGSSYRKIASHLNETGHTTRNRKAWSPTQVMRVLQKSTPPSQNETLT